MQIMCWVSLEFRCCMAGQDAPPTGLVLYGFPYNPTIVLLYKVELKISIAFAIRSVDPTLGLTKAGAGI